MPFENSHQHLGREVATRLGEASPLSEGSQGSQVWVGRIILLPFPREQQEKALPPTRERYWDSSHTTVKDRTAPRGSSAVTIYPSLLFSSSSYYYYNTSKRSSTMFRLASLQRWEMVLHIQNQCHPSPRGLRMEVIMVLISIKDRMSLYNKNPKRLGVDEAHLHNKTHPWWP